MNPTLRTKRLTLRPFNLTDADEVQRMASNYELYKTTLNIPHPYEEGMAEAWISSHDADLTERHLVTLALVRTEDNQLVGSLTLGMMPKRKIGEIGYWIGQEFWNQGYGTEASQAIIHYGFSELGLNKIIGRHFSNNPASGKIMTNCGLSLEGVLRQDQFKEGQFIDICYYGLLRSEWASLKNEVTADVRDHYDSAAALEWERLNNPYSRVEFLSTVSMIDKYFSKNGRVMDIGSGPGRYSLELLKRGYQVELLDLSKEELNLAETLIEKAGFEAEAYHCMSATELQDFNSSFYDNLLILGPMYHLHEEQDRLNVLNDAYRILKPGGTALLAYINTWGALKASVHEFPQSFEDINHIDRYLNGNLKFSKEESFTATFFTTPVLAMAEVQKSPFEIISYAGAESFLSGTQQSLKELSICNPLSYENYVQKAVSHCEAPQYRDTTEHLIFILKKPE